MDKEFTVGDKTYASWSEWTRSEEHQEYLQAMEDAKMLYEKEAAEKFESLPYEERLQMFFHVVKTMYQAEIVDQGSYRHALYGCFGFDTDAYALGMDCGYMALHNAIYADSTLEESLEKVFKLLEVDYDRKLFKKALDILLYGFTNEALSFKHKQLTLDLTWG